MLIDALKAVFEEDQRSTAKLLCDNYDIHNYITRTITTSGKLRLRKDLIKELCQYIRSKSDIQSIFNHFIMSDESDLCMMLTYHYQFNPLCTGIRAIKEKTEVNLYSYFLRKSCIHAKL